MKLNPKTLQVFLPEGTPAGIQIAELTTRIVQAISVPRTHLKAFFKREESENVGTYFLFGDDDESSKPIAYIGQTEDLHQRLRSHDGNKEFWTTAVILISRTRSFTQAHIKWLEWYALSKAKEANRYQLNNGNLAGEPFVTEAIQADLWEIYETGSLLLESLGYPIFEPLIPKTISQKKEDVWYLSKRSTQASATFTSEGIVVHKGSLCSKGHTKSSEGTYFLKRRIKMIAEGIIEKTDKGLVFAEDYRFKTPSGAASIISGASSNGWISWKNAAGKTLKEVKHVEPDPDGTEMLII